MYLVYGESFHLINEEVEKITKNSPNIVTMDLNINTLEDVLTEATYVSMFNEEKYIIVKNSYIFTSKKVHDSVVDLFLKYMENPVPLSKIIFTSLENIDLRKKLTKTFKEHYRIINTNIVKRDDLIYKLREYITSNKYKIETEAINYLITNLQSNYDLIYSELNKLLLYYNEPCMITYEDVKNITSKCLNDNNFKFVESVINKDLNTANNILKDLYTLKVDPIALISLLAREYRLILYTKILMSNGFYKDSLTKKLSLQDWQVDKLIKEGNNYSDSEIKKYLKFIAEIDYKIKRGIYDKFMALKLILINIE